MIFYTIVILYNRAYITNLKYLEDKLSYIDNTNELIVYLNKKDVNTNFAVTLYNTLNEVYK